LRKGKSPILLGEEREGKAEGVVGAGGVHWQRESASLFQVFLKPTLPHGRAGPGGAHPIMNQWRGV
jgi:hypothetical protein